MNSESRVNGDPVEEDVSDLSDKRSRRVILILMSLGINYKYRLLREHIAKIRSKASTS